MGLRLEPSAAVREKRLERLLADRGLRSDDAGLASIVQDAQLVGSLELSGISVSWEAARASHGADVGPPELLGLRRALAAVAPQEPVSAAAVHAWHAAIAGPVGLRRLDLDPGRPSATDSPRPSAPAAFVASRLEDLAGWLATAGSRDLSPEQAAAIALARIVEIRPFDDANGRVSRLAASHLMVRGGMRPPILVRGDGPRLRASLEAAFRLETEPLVALLVEASGRALDVMIQTLSAR
jgi:Fic/DOC family